MRLQLSLLWLSGLVFCESTSKLDWAPRRKLKKPYVTFLNDFFQPTWISTDNHTLENRIDLLIIPKDIYFGFICAACFSKGYISANLELYLALDMSIAYQKYGETFKVGDNECLMVYNFFYVNHAVDTVHCDLYLDLNYYQEHLSLFFFDLDETDGNGLIRERVQWTNETELDCKRRGDEYVPWGPNMTIWWYQNKKNTEKMLSISKNSTFSGRVPSGKMGCVTYEFNYGEATKRAYEKIYIGSSPSISSENVGQNPNLSLIIIIIINTLIVISFNQ